MKSYSQCGQDLYVIKKLNYKNNGYFLDWAASDGIHINNTLLLEQNYNWHGLCIEPNQFYYNKLIKNRKCDCLNVVIYNKNTNLEFVEIEGCEIGGVLEEIKDWHKDWIINDHPNWDKNPTIKKAMTPLAILELFDSPHTIDYLSLDIEESELSVLQEFPFDKYNVRIITVENNHEPNKTKIEQLLKDRGYTLDFHIPPDQFWYREDLV